MTGEVSDPGNVSALSSEVEGLIEEALQRLGPAHINDGYLGRGNVTPILRDLVRKALATVEAEKEALRAKAIDDVHRSTEAWHAAIMDLAASREQARALAEALRAMKSRYDHLCSVLVIRDSTWAIQQQADAALASWDTSQKESRGEQSEGREEGR